MNRYLIAALYVMAGCAVTIPLKGSGGCGESLRGERCRLIITNTVKVVSVYLEEEEEEQVFVPVCLRIIFKSPSSRRLPMILLSIKRSVSISDPYVVLPIRSGLLRFNLQIIIKIYEGSLSPDKREEIQFSERLTKCRQLKFYCLQFAIYN